MSAYLVADETINSVVEWVSWETVTNRFLQERLEKHCALIPQRIRGDEKTALPVLPRGDGAAPDAQIIGDLPEYEAALWG